MCVRDRELVYDETILQLLDSPIAWKYLKVRLTKFKWYVVFSVTLPFIFNDAVTDLENSYECGLKVDYVKLYVLEKELKENILSWLFRIDKLKIHQIQVPLNRKMEVPVARNKWITVVKTVSIENSIFGFESKVQCLKQNKFEYKADQYFTNRKLNIE